MARRRLQRGALSAEGRLWILRWREDVIVEGVVKRVEKRAHVGAIEDLPTKRLARRVADRMMGPTDAGHYQPGRVATVDEFSVLYQRDLLPSLKPSAAESYRSACRCYIEPVLGEHKLEDVVGQAPQLLINDMHRRGLARKTIANALTTLASMLSTAADWGYRSTKLDWDRLRLPTAPVERMERSFTPSESQALIDGAPYPWNLCFAFMAYLGVRTGEAVAITWDHVDLEAGVLMVRQSNWRGLIVPVKSKSSRRDLPIPATLLTQLRSFRSRWTYNEQGLLFANRQGLPITSCYVRRDILHPVRERLGILRGGFHAFRHGHATSMFSEGGANPRVVQASMGHAHINTTMRYTHLVSDDHRRAVEQTTRAFLATSAGKKPQSLRGIAGNESAKLLRVK